MLKEELTVLKPCHFQSMEASHPRSNPANVDFLDVYQRRSRVCRSGWRLAFVRLMLLAARCELVGGFQAFMAETREFVDNPLGISKDHPFDF